MQKQQERERWLDYNRFCSYSVNDILGISIESEYLYIIQSSKISVYEYHGKNDIPQLSQELIHNKIIQSYSINKYYICICSDSLIEVRDRKHWENVIFTWQVGKEYQEEGGYCVLEEHFLYVAKKDNGNFVIQKIDVENKGIVTNIQLGKISQSGQLSKSLRPIFLNNLGMLKDFYIWAKTSKKIELGMLYQGQGTQKMKFQINQIQISDGNIKHVFHHRIGCVKYPNQSTEYVGAIIQKTDKQLYLHLYEIASKYPSKKEQKEQDQFQGQLQGIINQFSFLKNINQPTTTNSLVQQVFNDAIANQKVEKTHIQIKLEGLSTYQSSSLFDGKIWVSSQQKICEIELISQQDIQSIVKHKKTSQSILKSIIYYTKPKGKHFIGIYKQKQLFTQATISFEIAFHRQGNEQIVEQIEQYEINDQILDKEDKQAQRIIEEAEKHIDDFIRFSLEEKDKEMEKEKDENILADYCSQTELFLKQTKQFSTQTLPIQEKVIQKPVSVGLQSIQDLVAKFTSSVSVSCTKVKQNSYIKDKFDRQIFHIVDTIVKDSVQPYLQNKFISHLDQKIKDITQHISTVFQTQLEALNQFVRKNQVKESNLRGRRIFQFTTQINDIKETVSIITDTLKANQLQKYAFNQIILQQAKQMKQQISKISTSILELDQRNQVLQKEINSQIGEVFQLIKTLQEKQKENMEEDSECQREESEDESEQREVEETSEQQDLSVDSKQEFQREQRHYQYGPYNPYGRGIQEMKRNKKPVQSLEKQGYTPYPSPQFYHHATTQMPYYYPFMPQIPSVPMHNYYPNYPYPVPHKKQSKSNKHKSKAAKKGKE